ncbi:uncharacterized protein K452DRAFT_323392 [Aplosporella prunicola CBS 121167]|uniref:F-box domain-containing protein n=1 Tax=Aplosporella prunicola CBS 121167 TaxID=1176127 RepID=A0A6A6BT98_9PEZI|nr:uncharacterized protein K452DRAFT_323392 [Aplosporella prunicola CBS 121167]KAF2147220.1 hypothetical protein K452DRAFT_323392 [Aplosporella prunicola CBS 121167]
MATTTPATVPTPLTKTTGLSVEIWSMIIDYVLRPTDLKNLCLTCKQFHQIAVRPLYREVTLDVGSTADLNLGAFLNPRNAGLHYIRQLHIYLAEVQDKRNQLQQAHFAVRMILEFLPENILERFSWHPWQPFSADNLLLLYRKQRRMTWLEAISLDKNILDQLEDSSDLACIEEHTRTLGLYPDSRGVLDLCNTLIRKNRRVENLIINASFNPADAGFSARELHDSSTGPGLITSKLFGHMQPLEQCKPLALTELTLQRVHLRYSADTYCRAIKFVTLKKLGIFECPGACTLFAELSKSSKLPQSLEILEFKHEDNRESDALHALDNFLYLVTGLKALTIDICNVGELPAAAGVVRHGKTLRQLNVHANNGLDAHGDEHVYSTADFRQICRDCPYLEELSIGFPETSIMQGKSDGFAAFEDDLNNLPNLVSLNITTWPKHSPSSGRLPRSIYTLLLQNIAQSLLAFHRPVLQMSGSDVPRSSHLNLIAFGAADRAHGRADDERYQVVFIKGRQIDPFGSESPLAVKVRGELRKYVEPRSEVLNFALSRSTRMPTDDGGSAPGW